MDRVPCPQCGEEHDLSDLQIGFARPDAWFAVPKEERARRVKMDSDFAVIDDTHCFLRGVLEIPVRGEVMPFGWGIWVRVDQDVFRRHAYAGREGLPDVPAASDGRIATQVPGFPQTLGVAVLVQASEDITKRPSFTVTDHRHPLSIEQRDGIHVERALEHMSLLFHRGEVEARRLPRVAVLGIDGWELDDPLPRFHAREGVNWLPDASLREAIQPGEAAKLIFAIAASAETGEPEVHRERMWVEVDHIEGSGAQTRYTGAVTNTPSVPGLTRRGMRVWFHPDHVIDVARKDGWMASGDRSVLRCATHGPSHKAYVCQHVARGTGVGFNQAEDPGNPRPDAWCDACDRILEEEGDWTPRAEDAAKVGLICASCYDAAEKRNRG